MLSLMLGIYSKDRRLPSALTIFIFIFTCIFLHSFVGYCDIVPDEYMPPSYLYDGFKYILQEQIIYELQDQPIRIETPTTYVWIDGIQQISGVNCWRTYSSILGFYKDHGDEANKVVSYSTIIGDEYRIYGAYLSLKDGSTTTTRFYPYRLQWKYGQQIGSQYTHSYSGDLETISDSSTISCTLNGTDVTRIIGYETVVGPFGTFENCLKWERDSTIKQTCLGYSITNNTKETSWSALNKGVVKNIVQVKGGKITSYSNIEVGSGPVVPLDSDGDGIYDIIENQSHCLDPNDADTDDDGIPDGVEDVNKNGVVDDNETDPCNIDTDGDGIQDGTELGYSSEDIGSDTDINVFQPDLDPSTTTDPLNVDTDGDGLSDGDEDANHNGKVDQGETDPKQTNKKAMPWIPLLLFSDDPTPPPDPTVYTNSLGMTFKLIPAGTFTMGSPTNELGRYSPETQHEVTLTQSFFMQTTEVTQGQWAAVMGSNPSYFIICGNDCPVERVSWNDIQIFLAAMNALGEGTYRLPTEAEWEYSARAGSTSALANGDITVTDCSYDANLDAMGWYCYNSASITHPVAQKDANAWGLYDMHGNVWEWVQDWTQVDLGSDPVTDPTGPSSGLVKERRGGSCLRYAYESRSAYRFASGPAYGGVDIGFRLVRNP